MAEEIRDLIAKIQNEGIKVAEDKARRIEMEAKELAEQIINNAKTQSAKLIGEAQEKINKMQDTSKSALKQAGRNMLISLKEEINSLLDKIVLLSARETLTPALLSKILHSLIIETAKQNKGNIIISLNKDDVEKLEKGFLAQLKQEIKKEITLKSSEDISAGFLISFDEGKSHFDFTEEALADYISQYLKPELAKLLK
ncbi:MAG: V-type ATP synthase subunit E family protein [Candidatus Omnitrophota bacterium]